jgi:hypothetical protein
LPNETQAVLGRADRGHREAGGDGDAGGGTDPAGGISEQTFYRWKKQFTGLEIDQVGQLKQLQDENGRLKKLVAELTLDRAMLQDVLRKNW